MHARPAYFLSRASTRPTFGKREGLSAPSFVAERDRGDCLKPGAATVHRVDLRSVLEPHPLRRAVALTGPRSGSSVPACFNRTCQEQLCARFLVACCRYAISLNGQTGAPLAWGGRSSRAAAARTGRAEGDEALGWDIFGFTTPSDVGSPGKGASPLNTERSRQARRPLLVAYFFGGAELHYHAEPLSIAAVVR